MPASSETSPTTSLACGPQRLMLHDRATDRKNDWLRAQDFALAAYTPRAAAVYNEGVLAARA